MAGRETTLPLGLSFSYPTSRSTRELRLVDASGVPESLSFARFLLHTTEPRAACCHASAPRVASAGRARSPRKKQAPPQAARALLIPHAVRLCALTHACKFVPAAWRAAQTDAEDDEEDAPDLEVRRAGSRRVLARSPWRRSEHIPSTARAGRAAAVPQTASIGNATSQARF